MCGWSPILSKSTVEMKHSNIQSQLDRTYETRTLFRLGVSRHQYNIYNYIKLLDFLKLWMMSVCWCPCRILCVCVAFLNNQKLKMKGDRSHSQYSQASGYNKAPRLSCARNTRHSTWLDACSSTHKSHTKNIYWHGFAHK